MSLVITHSKKLFIDLKFCVFIRKNITHKIFIFFNIYILYIPKRLIIYFIDEPTFSFSHFFLPTFSSYFFLPPIFSSYFFLPAIFSSYFFLPPIFSSYFF